MLLHNVEYVAGNGEQTLLVIDAAGLGLAREGL